VAVKEAVKESEDSDSSDSDSSDDSDDEEEKVSLALSILLAWNLPSLYQKVFRYSLGMPER